MGHRRTFQRVLDGDTRRKEKEENKRSPTPSWAWSWHLCPTPTEMWSEEWGTLLQSQSKHCSDRESDLLMLWKWWVAWQGDGAGRWKSWTIVFPGYDVCQSGYFCPVVTISDLALFNFSFYYTTWLLRCHLHGRHLVTYDLSRWQSHDSTCLLLIGPHHHS